MNYKKSVAIAVLTLIAACGAFAQTNLASSATATASCESEGNMAASINDGNIATVWTPTNCGPGADSWVQLHWQSALKLTKLVVQENNVDLYTDIKRLEVKANIGGNWQDVDITCQADAIGNTTVTFAVIETTDIKVVLKEANDDWSFVDIAEITAIYEAPVNALAQDAVASSSGLYAAAYPDSNLNDGRVEYDSRWASGTPGIPPAVDNWMDPLRWVQLKWNNPVAFNKVIAYVGDPFNKSWSLFGYWLQISDDGMNWTTLQHCSSLNLNNVVGTTPNYAKGLIILLPEPVVTRYLRLKFLPFASSANTIIYEVMVFNDEAVWSTISGKITDATSGVGIADAQIEILHVPFETYWPESYSCETDANGNYTLTVPAGTYTLDVRGPGYVKQTPNVTVEAGENRTLNLQLARGANYPAVSWTAPNTSNGLQMVSPLDGNYWSGAQMTTAGPDNRPCVKRVGYFLDFDVDDSFYKGTADRAWLTLTYLDNDTDLINVDYFYNFDKFGLQVANQFNWYTGNMKSIGCIIPRYGTGQWVTRTIGLPGAVLSNSTWILFGNPDVDIMLENWYGGEDYISSASLTLVPPANYGKMPLSITFGSPNIEDGLIQAFNGRFPDTRIQGLKTVTEPIGGKSAVRTNISQGCTTIGIDVDDTRLCGHNDVYVEVEYFDNGTDYLYVWFYKNNSATNDPKEYNNAWVQKTNTNTWKKFRFHVPQMMLNNILGYDFFIWADGTAQADHYIHKVTLSDKPFVDVTSDKISDILDPTLLGKTVQLTSSVFTNSYGPWCYWIEDENRAGAVRVNPKAGAAVPSTPGQRISVKGYLNIDWTGQLVISDGEFTPLWLGDPLKPLGVVNKDVVPSSGAQVNAHYIKIWGNVVDVSNPTGLFRIDDGSGRQLVVDIADRTYEPTTYQIGDYVSIEGTAACYGDAGILTWKDKIIKHKSE